MSEQTESLSRSRLMLIGLVSIFVGPLILASILYAYRDKIDLPDALAYGELVTPARPVERISAIDLDGDVISKEDLHGLWTLLYLGDAHCDLDCEAGLFKLRQVRLTLGRERTRVQRWYLYSNGEASEHLRAILQRHSGMRTARLNAPLEQLLQGLPDNGIFIIDPLGNLMMHYDDSATSRGIQKDMKRLLRTSQIG